MFMLNDDFVLCTSHNSLATKLNEKSCFYYDKRPWYSELAERQIKAANKKNPKNADKDDGNGNKDDNNTGEKENNGHDAESQ